MVPQCHNRHTPRAIVPNVASCRIVNTFLVAGSIKSKVTRECDLSQVNFIDKGFEDAANPLVALQLHLGFHMLCAKHSPELDAVETPEVGLSTDSPEEQNGRAGKRLRAKPQVMQCVRESHIEPDEEHSTNSRPEVTMLFQFKCHAIFPRHLQCCCKTQKQAEVSKL